MRAGALCRATAAVAVVVLVLPASALAQDRDVDTIEGDLEESRGEQRRTEEDLGALEQDVAAARDRLIAIQRRLDSARAELRVAEGQVALAEQALADAEEVRAAAAAALEQAEAELARVQAELDREQRRLEDQVASTYKYGAPTGMLAFSLVSNARSPNEFAVNLYQLHAVMDYQDGVVERVDALRAEQASRRAEADAARREAAAAAETAAVALAEVEEQRDRAVDAAARVADEEAAQRATLAGLESDAAHRRAVLAAMEAEEQRLERELEEARARAARSASGALCPVVPSWFSDDWGNPRSGGRNHEGTDVFADRGVPVWAMYDGVVKQIDRNPEDGDLGGLWVTVFAGGGGDYWYYAHLDSVADIRVGQWIEAGTTIGYTGNSGNARGTPPHTHIGHYISKGNPVNPYPVLADACGPNGAH